LRRDEPLALPTGEQWIEIRLAPLFGEQGAVTSVMGVCRDITERKRAERQLAEALDLNQKMIAASTMGIAAYRASGECVFANEALARTVGGSVSEVQQGNFRHLQSWQESGLLEMAEATLRQGKARRGEMYTTTRFGKSIWVDCHTAPFVSNGQPHLLIMILDVTEQKAADALLRAQRDLGVQLSLTSDLNAALNGLIEIATHLEAVDCGGIHLIDPATGQLNLAVNRGVAAAFTEAVSHIAADAPQAKLVRAGQPVYMHYSRLPIARSSAQKSEGLRAAALIPLCHEGAILGSLNLASHQFDEIPPQTRIVIESIAAQAAGAIARIRAEEALRQSETRLRAIISGAPVVLFAVDRDGILRFEDGQALNALGETPGANVGRSVKEAYAHMPGILENSRRALLGEQFESVVQVGPTTLDCWYSPTRDKNGHPAGYIGVATNITERHRLERQILEISDREQARIGQDIHDGLCQQLVSLAFDANALRRELSASNRPEAKIALRIADFLDQAITESRQLSRGLFPVRAGTVGLSPALQELADDTSTRFKIRCRFEGKGPVAVKNAAVATHLYRIAQEAVANAVKHSQARSVRIRLRTRHRQLELIVEDDGVGLSPDKKQKATGLGLHILDYRARAIGGTLQTGPGRRGGTIVSCCVPQPSS
jgi:PAS domain S-box-containing protein